MKNMDSWEEVGNRLIKTFYFNDSAKVTRFVNKVMEINKKQTQRPEMVIHHDWVKLSICDIVKGNVTPECVMLAKTIDSLA